MDEFKIESESHNDSDLKPSISEDANERISVIPAVKCEAEVSHVVYTFLELYI
jgi:hypothetical protein